MMPCPSLLPFLALPSYRSPSEYVTSRWTQQITVLLPRNEEDCYSLILPNDLLVVVVVVVVARTRRATNKRDWRVRDGWGWLLRFWRRVLVGWLMIGSFRLFSRSLVKYLEQDWRNDSVVWVILASVFIASNIICEICASVFSSVALRSWTFTSCDSPLLTSDSSFLLISSPSMAFACAATNRMRR